jgi:hypothetical protein
LCRTKGIPLPFISYGGSSLVPTLAGVGILLNISQYAALGKRERADDGEYEEDWDEAPRAGESVCRDSAPRRSRGRVMGEPCAC